MTFQNLTRDVEIGANCYLLTLGGSRILLDAGMNPGTVGLEATPALDRLEFDTVDAIIVTHAHLDHVGSLPVIQRLQPSAQVYLSEPTADLADAMLHNSVNVMSSQKEELDVTEYPLFTHREVDRAAREWQRQVVGRPFSIGKESDGIECEFHHSGHILGSVGVSLRHGGKTILYTSDVHFEDQTLTRAAILPEEQVDVLIMEATRGDAPRAAGYTRDTEVDRLTQAIQATLDRGGAVLMPLFALGKTQELLTILDQSKKNGAIEDAPIYLGGLSAKMTSLYDRHAGHPHRYHGDFRILEHMDLVMSSRKRRGRRPDIPYRPGCVYAISSGMMTENTHSNRFAKNILPEPNNSLLFVGYCAPDSPGGRILASAPGDEITINSEEPPLPLACQVERFDFSGHAPRDDLRDFAVRAAPEQVLLVHGDPPAAAWLREAIGQGLPECAIAVPGAGEVVALGKP